MSKTLTPVIVGTTYLYRSLSKRLLRQYDSHCQNALCKLVCKSMHSQFFHVMGDTAQSRSSPYRGWLRRSLPATTCFDFFMSWETQHRAAVAPTGGSYDAHCLQRHIVSMHATRATGHRAAMCKTAPCTPYSPVRLGAWILWGFCEASPSCASCMVVEACSTTCFRLWGFCKASPRCA